MIGIRGGGKNKINDIRYFDIADTYPRLGGKGVLKYVLGVQAIHYKGL